MNDRTLQNLRRRLERWELDHLRHLAAELHERLERAEEAKLQAEKDASRAWERAEFWRENAFELQEALMADDFTIGLTKEGQMVAIKNTSSPDVEVRNDRVEQVDGLAHEDHAIAITGGSQNHLDTGSDCIGGFDINPMNAASEPRRIEVGGEEADAVIECINNGAASDIADDHSHAEPLAADANGHDGQLNAVDGRQQDAADLHESPMNVTWPGGNIVQSIDWSPLAGRTLIVHPDNGHDKVAPETP